MVEHFSTSEKKYFIGNFRSNKEMVLGSVTSKYSIMHCKIPTISIRIHSGRTKKWYHKNLVPWNYVLSILNCKLVQSAINILKMTILRYTCYQLYSIFNQLYISNSDDILLFTLNYFFVQYNKLNKQIKKNIIQTVLLHLELMMLIKTFMKS